MIYCKYYKCFNKWRGPEEQNVHGLWANESVFVWPVKKHFSGPVKKNTSPWLARDLVWVILTPFGPKIHCRTSLSMILGYSLGSILGSSKHYKNNAFLDLGHFGVPFWGAFWVGTPFWDAFLTPNQCFPMYLTRFLRYFWVPLLGPPKPARRISKLTSLFG